MAEIQDGFDTIVTLDFGSRVRGKAGIFFLFVFLASQFIMFSVSSSYYMKMQRV